MRLYLDTSALLKLYVQENGTTLVRGVIENARLGATSAITYVEARAAFARRSRDGDISLSDFRSVVRQFHDEWPNYVHVHVTDSLIMTAGDAAEKYHLRAYDALHLASALTLKECLSAPVIFACWDSRLESVARRAGLESIRRP